MDAFAPQELVHLVQEDIALRVGLPEDFYDVRFQESIAALQARRR
jgi:hypothetical protein